MPKTSYGVGVVGTILVHLLVLVLFLEFSSSSHSNQQPAQTADTPVDVVLLTEAEADAAGSIADPLYTPDGKACPPGSKTYLGVGFVYETDTGEIYQAPAVLPAHKAGIRTGDLLLNNPFPDADGMMYIKILRGYTQLTFEIKAVEICYSPEPLVSA